MSRAKLAEPETPADAALPELPAEEESLDRDHPINESLRILKDAELDVSGFEKSRRSCLRLQAANEAINVEQLRLLAEATPLRQRYQDLGDPLRPYRTATPPLRPPADLVPLEVERLALEKPIHELDAAYLTGAEKLQECAEALQKARLAARRALAGTLRTYCARLGTQARALVEPRGEFFRRFPHQLPAEALELLQQAGGSRCSR